jgi:hypothetical protein
MPSRASPFITYCILSRHTPPSISHRLRNLWKASLSEDQGSLFGDDHVTGARYVLRGVIWFNQTVRYLSKMRKVKLKEYLLSHYEKERLRNAAQTRVRFPLTIIVIPVLPVPPDRHQGSFRLSSSSHTAQRSSVSDSLSRHHRAGCR